MEIHSTVCEGLKLERAVARTADTIQKAYFAFRKPLFDKSIVKVEERDHELVLYLDNAEDGTKKGWFMDFPNHLIQNEGIADAILCFLMGREPLAYLLNLIRYLTDDMEVKVEEVQVRLKDIPRNMTVIYTDGVQRSIHPENPHFLLRLTSRESKKTWAIDITGAQFGLTQRLWPWEEYLIKHIETVEIISELDTSWTLLRISSVLQGAPSLDFGIPFAAIDCVDLAIKRWEETELDKRVFVYVENFSAAQESLIQTIEEATRTFVDQSDYSKEVQEAIEYEQKNPNVSRKELEQLYLAVNRSMHFEPHNKHCSSCGEQATTRCSQCRVHVYCNAKCQRAHWFEHKKVCNTKNLDKIMYRAGALLQKLYLAFRRITFRDQFSKIEDSGRHLTIHTKPFAIPGVTFSPFPDSLVPSEKEKNMVLCASGCGNFVGHFKEVIEMILKDCDVIVNEICVKMKPPERSAILVVEGHGSSEGGHNSHYLLQVTKHLPFKQWIFDITGPQLNVFDPCLSLSTYSAKYVDRFRLTAPLGTARILCDNLAELKGIASLKVHIDQDAVRALEMGIREWQTRSSSTLPGLLRQPKSLFENQQQDLLTIVQKTLTQFVLSADYTSEFNSGNQDMSTLEAATAIFSKHEEYLKRFYD